MENFVPFIHKIEKKKEFQPLYIQLEKPLEQEMREKEEEEKTIIILEF